MDKTKYIKLFAKLLIILASYSFIVYKLYNYQDLSEIMSGIFSFSLFQLLILFFVCVLMLLNWTLESFKWKYLIKTIEEISLLKSFKAVFVGITAALFTPNRIGEFGGRILVLEKSNRTKGVLSTIIGSTSQLLVTIVLGSMALVILLLFFNDKILFENQNRYIIVIGLLILSSVSVYLYFNIKFVSKISKIRFLRKWEEHFHVFSQYSKSQLLKILSFSILRYIVFIIQFYLLFVIFEVSLNFYQSVLIITATYYIMAIIPSITFAELGIRGSVIIFFTEIFIPEFAGTLSASIVLWTINLAIPAIFGSVILSKLRI